MAEFENALKIQTHAAAHFGVRQPSMIDFEGTPTDVMSAQVPMFKAVQAGQVNDPSFPGPAFDWSKNTRNGLINFLKGLSYRG